ncbi:MAG: DUF116 domain-containing protein [Candidatus Sumerlaeaceae bacterium]
MSFEQNLNDRKLGHEWYGWDGNIDAHEAFIKEPKRLFMGMVAFTFGLIFAGACLLAWGFYPRLQSLHPALGTASLTLVLLLAATFLTLFGTVSFALLSHKPVKLAESIGMRLLQIFPLICFVARQCGISKDRLGYSLVEVHNELTRIRLRKASNGRILVLSPRCLDRENVEQIRALTSEYDCDFYMAPTGAQARQKIVQVKPAAIIGIACERDLITGIRDVGYHYPVIGVTNKRPAGPCKGAFIDMSELRNAIEIFRDRYEIRSNGSQSDFSEAPVGQPQVASAS